MIESSLLRLRGLLPKVIETGSTFIPYQMARV